MGDFNPNFSFDFGPAEGPTQAPWEFSGAIKQALKEQKPAPQATTVDQKIQKRLQAMQKEKQARRDKKAKAAAAKKVCRWLPIPQALDCGSESRHFEPCFILHWIPFHNDVLPACGRVIVEDDAPRDGSAAQCAKLAPAAPLATLTKPLHTFH